ncbi:6,7-dimethyl-8-ribityllumazine synthase [bacterium BMS3Abin02]|nr:6,7-dimethyl-8-ribityllumazine synthase [bacterium BMS3Abin02]GBE21397.1 6,7-dimethyl-8-ribityllumazine synthase [bacterium BMS3Bbin01]HDH24588.1 6,7-dimethyl-8-ribityllumazine synthase [Actinomycetota bacterium]HDL49711.1 6,7-dimethyl-8-ribityllumazine synthase [Actinomycetota bacterium]
MQLREIRGEAMGEGRRVGVVVASFNRVITDGLLAGALEALEASGTEQVTVVRVPGSLEIPLVVQRLAQTGHDAVVAVGAVIKGETDHYEHVGSQSIAGLVSVSLATGVPVGNAVLTVTEFEHARDRSLPGPANKGYEAAMAVLAMLDVLERIG